MDTSLKRVDELFHLARRMRRIALQSAIGGMALLEKRSLEPLVKLLTDTMRDRLRQHFNEVVSAHTFDVADVAAGREYVRAYVEFIHFVERIYETSSTAVHGRFDETSAIQREHR